MLISSPLPLQLDILHSIFNILITSFSSRNAHLSSRWYYSHLALSRHLSRTDMAQVPEVNVLERVDYMLKFRFHCRFSSVTWESQVAFSPLKAPEPEVVAEEMF